MGPAVLMGCFLVHVCDIVGYSVGFLVGSWQHRHEALFSWRANGVRKDSNRSAKGLMVYRWIAEIGRTLHTN